MQQTSAHDANDTGQGDGAPGDGGVGEEATAPRVRRAGRAPAPPLPSRRGAPSWPAAPPGLPPLPAPRTPEPRAREPRAPERRASERRAPRPPAPVAPGRPYVRDLRGRAGAAPRVLGFPAGDLVVVSGLPGSGKSTFMARVARAPRIDSQDTRELWERRLPRLPYALYRPLVRVAHYAGLYRALRSGTSLVVHDCGTQSWVRRWLTTEARRRGAGLHLLLLDVDPGHALAGQRTRGRRVSRYAFHRHRRALARLLDRAVTGRLPQDRGGVLLLDRPAADGLCLLVFRTPRPPHGAA